jgi:hypothetical protein
LKADIAWPEIETPRECRPPMMAFTSKEGAIAGCAKSCLVTLAVNSDSTINSHGIEELSRVKAPKSPIEARVFP